MKLSYFMQFMLFVLFTFQILTINGSEEEDSSICDVCYASCSVQAEFPCKHRLCYDCFTKIHQNKQPCHLCRKPIPNPRNIETYKLVGTKSDNQITEDLFAHILEDIMTKNKKIPEEIADRILYQAIERQRFDFVKILLKKGIDFENGMKQILTVENVVKEGYQPLLDLFVEEATARILRGENILHARLRIEVASSAVRKNDLNLVKKLQSKDFNFKAHFLNAVIHEHIEMVQHLMYTTDYDINHINPANENSALIYAVGNDNLQLIKLLLQDPNIKITKEIADLMLYQAIERKNFDFVEILLKKGIDFEDGIEQFVTTQNVVKEGYQPLLDHFVEEATARILRGDRIVHERLRMYVRIYTVQRNNLSLVKKLQSKGLNFAPQLLNSVIYGLIDMTQHLMSTTKYDINQMNPANKKSLLIYAVENNNLEITKLLLQDPNIKINVLDNENKSAMEYVCKNKHTEKVKNRHLEFAKILDAAGANPDFKTVNAAHDKNLAQLSERLQKLEQEKQNLAKEIEKLEKERKVKK